MQEVFEKIVENLEKKKKKCFDTANQLSTDEIGIWCFDRAKEIVTQVAAEYNNGWIPCSERLPEEDGWYYTTEKFGDTFDSGMCKFVNGAWEHSYPNIITVAWMPKQEPYHQPNICGEVDCPYNDGKECPAWNGCGGYEPKGE